MQIHHRPAGIVIHTPAKLNLFFEVLAKRTDGYHEIESLMCPIGMFDSLVFQDQSAHAIEFSCRRGSAKEGLDSGGFDSVPQDAENLVVRAVELVREVSGVRRGAKITLLKRIPTAAGLGGGSSDAAAALVAANLGWNLRLPITDLMAMAARLGSDVPFFLAGGTAVCRGRGERIERVEGLARLDFVVVRPKEGLSTPAVYRVCRPAATPRSVSGLIDSMRTGDSRTIGELLFNRLQSAAEGLTPCIGRLRGLFAKEDCLGHGMSGSGTAYFGLFQHARQAKRVARRLLTGGAGSVVAVQSC